MILTSEVLCCCRVLEPSHVVLPDQERLRGAVQGHCRYRGQRLVGGDSIHHCHCPVYALSFLCVVFNQKLNKIGLTPKIVHRSTAKYRGCAGVARYAISLHTNSSLTMQFNLQTIFAGTQDTHINFHILIICNKIATKIFENHLTQYNYCWHTCSKSWSL